MVCTYAGQIIMGGCVRIELRPWKRVALTRIAALGPALVVSAATISNQVSTLAEWPIHANVHFVSGHDRFEDEKGRVV